MAVLRHVFGSTLRVVICGLVLVGSSANIVTAQDPYTLTGIYLPLGFRISFPINMFITDGMTLGSDKVCDKIGEVFEVACEGHSLMSDAHELNFRRGVVDQLKAFDKECAKYNVFSKREDFGSAPATIVYEQKLCYSKLGTEQAGDPNVTPGPGSLPLPLMPSPNDPATFPKRDQVKSLCMAGGAEGLQIATPPRGNSYGVLVLKQEDFVRNFCECTSHRFCIYAVSGELISCGVILEDDIILDDEAGDSQGGPIYYQRTEIASTPR